MNYKDNYKARLSDLTKTAEYVIYDIEKKYNLQNGGLCRVTLKDGKVKEGFYQRSAIKSFIYERQINIFLLFKKLKKDDTQAKTSFGEFITNIENIENGI